MTNLKKILLPVIIAAMALSLAACGEANEAVTPNTSTQQSSSSVTSDDLPASENTLVFDRAMEIHYAQNFTVDYYQGGYKLIETIDGTQVLTIPEGAAVPSDAPAGAIILQMPLDNILMTSTPTMSYVNAIGALDRVTATTFDISSWYLPEVIAALEQGEMTYIGASKEPDYELMLTINPAFSVHSTMIDSYTGVREKYAELNIPVFVDHSSFESHPLARTEWMMLYAALCDLEDEASVLMQAQIDFVEGMEFDGEASEKPTVAVFYVSSSGDVYVRNGGDYIAKMVELAGARYICDDLDPDDSGTTKMDMERFYSIAKEADYILYVGSSSLVPDSIDGLIAKNELFAEFTAVHDDKVFACMPNFFQIPDQLGNFIADVNSMLLDAGTVDQYDNIVHLR